MLRNTFLFKYNIRVNFSPNYTDNISKTKLYIDEKQPDKVYKIQTGKVSGLFDLSLFFC